MRLAGGGAALGGAVAVPDSSGGDELRIGGRVGRWLLRMRHRSGSMIPAAPSIFA